MGADFRFLANDRAIDMVDHPPTLADQPRGMGQEQVGRSAFPLRIGGREMLADVTKSGGSEQRVGDRVNNDIGVAVAGETP